MGYWDYTNVGASAKPENRELVERIFKYIGYAESPAYSGDGEDCSFGEPDVYCCQYSANVIDSGLLKGSFANFKPYDLLCLLNALFPETVVYVHSAEGNNTSDTWENHDTVYDVKDMTCYQRDSYTDYGGDGPNGLKTYKFRFVLKPPEMEYVTALFEISKEKGNAKLTELLMELINKLSDGQVIFKSDHSDERVVGLLYDIVDDVQGLDDSIDDGDDEEDEEYEMYNEEEEEIKVEDENGFVLCNGRLVEYNGEEVDIVIPGSVIEIGNRAFENSDVEDVVIPDGVVSIGSSAFIFCSSLTAIRIPDSVKNIGHHAFTDCESLQNITIPDGVTMLGEKVFSSTALNHIIDHRGCSSIVKGEYTCCDELVRAVIPDYITDIGDSAFEFCDNLEEVIIPDSVKSIGTQAFSSCESLKKIIIPESVTKIGLYTFDDDIIVTVTAGSYAEEYCKANKLKYVYR